MNDALDHAVIADLAGITGFVLIAAWPLLRGRQALLGGQAACAGAFALHYALIGAGTGAAMMLLSMTQVAAAWKAERRWWGRGLYAATFPAVLWLGWSTWAGPVSLFAALGLLLSTLGRWQCSAVALRLLFLASAAAWLVHDLLAGSVQGVCGDLLGAGALLYGLYRDVGRRVFFWIDRPAPDR